MTLVPVQFFGIGDIIFEQTLLINLAQGQKILWPVLPSFVEGLSRAYPQMQFVDMHTLSLDYERRNEYVVDDMRVLPLRFADGILGLPYEQTMKSKYLLYNMDWQDWKQHAMWQRDVVKEKALQDMLDITVGTPYNLVNVYYGSDSPFKIEQPVTDNGFPTIHMRTIDGFSLFDWAPIIEKAATIHTVSTSIIYLLEQLAIAAPEVHLYARKPHEPHFKNVDYLLHKHRYIYHL